MIYVCPVYCLGINDMSLICHHTGMLPLQVPGVHAHAASLSYNIILGWCKSSRGWAFAHSRCGVHDINVTFPIFHVKHWYEANLVWVPAPSSLVTHGLDSQLHVNVTVTSRTQILMEIDVHVSDWAYKPFIGAWCSQWLTKALWINRS